MSISIKNGNGWAAITAPYMKLAAGSYTPATRVLVKTDANTWSEVWPMQKMYIHTGTHYTLNIAALFGNPTTPSNFVFVNNGYIGGAQGAYALTTGTFPAGSSLTIINNGYILGAGGYGGGRIFDPYPPTQAYPGWPALLLQFPTNIQNVGQIFGGGGGGAVTSFTPKRQGRDSDSTPVFCPGGGGAGLPAGPAGYGGTNNHSVDGWDGAPGSLYAGGVGGFSNSRAYFGGSGGANGAPGGSGLQGGTNAAISTYPGGAAGHSIDGSSYIITFTGNNSNLVRGPMA